MRDLAMKIFPSALLYLLLLSSLTACDNGNETTPYEPQWSPYMSASFDLSEGGQTFNNFLVIYEPDLLINDEAWEEEFKHTERVWHRVEFSGAHLVEPLEWVDESCGPTIEWKYVDEDARRLVQEYYANLPLLSNDDIDNLHQYTMEAPPTTPLPPNWNPETDPLPEPPHNKRKTGWYFAFRTPDAYLLSLLPQNEHTQAVVDMLKYFTQEYTDSGWDYNLLTGTKVIADLPEEATAARAFVTYQEDFNKKTLRAYLEKNQPECLVQ